VIKTLLRSHLPRISRDAKILIGLNSIAMMLTNLRNIYVPIFLHVMGLSPAEIGIYLTILTFTSIGKEVGFAVLSDWFGRKKLLLTDISMSSLFYLILITSKDLRLIYLSAVFAYGGVRSPILNALLSDTATDSERTQLFTMKLFFSSLFTILAPILSGLPALAQIYGGVDELSSFNILFWIGLAMTVLCMAMAPMVKERRGKARKRVTSISKEQMALILKLATTNSLDIMAVGITLNLFSLWLALRYNVGIGVVSIIFTFAQIAETFAYLPAPFIASRIGNVKGTVIIRAVGFILIAALAFCPTPTIAAVVYAARNAVQRMSHPLRESYIMAVLDPDVRASGSAFIEIPRIPASSVGPLIGGYLLEISTALNPLTSGAIFGLGDILYWMFFRDVKPPEERHRQPT